MMDQLMTEHSSQLHRNILQYIAVFGLLSNDPPNSKTQAMCTTTPRSKVD